MQPRQGMLKRANKQSFTTALLAGLCVLPSAVSLAAGAPQDSTEVVQTLNALGLDAESLASIDVIGSEPSVVLDRLVEEYASYESYLALQENIAANQRIVHISNAALRDQSDDVEAQQALDEAEAQVVLLSNLARDTKTALVNTILDGLANTQLIAPVIHSLGSQQLPPAYRVAVDTPDEAQLLAWALKMQAAAQANDTGITNEAQDAIGAAQAQYDVQSALGRVVTHEQPNQLTIDEWVLTH